MKNFQEKEIKDLSIISGGQDPLTIGFTIQHKNFGNHIFWDAEIHFDDLKVESK